MKKSAFKLFSLILVAGLADCGVATAADLYPTVDAPSGAFILPTANVVTASQQPAVPAISTLDAAVGNGGAFVAPGASSSTTGSTIDAGAQLRNERISLDPPPVAGSGAGGYNPNTIPNSRDLAIQGAMGPASTGPASRTLDPNTSGRVLNNSYGGDWFDYCGPKGRSCCSQIYFAADAWLMDRRDATLKQIALNSVTGASALNTVDPNFRWDEVAPRLTFGRLFCDWAIEGNILYIDNIDAHANTRPTTVGNTAVWFGAQPAGSNWTGSTGMGIDIYDGLHSYELNAIDTRSFFQMIYGFRYIEFREHLTVQSSSATGTSNGEIGTYNRMLGAQIGLRMNYIGDLADWEFNLKGGLYQNDQDNSTLIRDANNTVLIRNTRTGGQNEAYQAEATLAVNYRINNSLKARFGYQVMYIGEIALAPDQISEVRTAAGNTTGFINDAHGDMFLRGFTAGLEYRW